MENAEKITTDDAQLKGLETEYADLVARGEATEDDAGNPKWEEIVRLRTELRGLGSDTLAQRKVCISTMEEMRAIEVLVVRFRYRGKVSISWDAPMRDAIAAAAGVLGLTVTYNYGNNAPEPMPSNVPSDHWTVHK